MVGGGGPFKAKAVNQMDAGGGRRRGGGRGKGASDISTLYSRIKQHRRTLYSTTQNKQMDVPQSSFEPPPPAQSYLLPLTPVRCRTSQEETDADQR